MDQPTHIDNSLNSEYGVDVFISLHTLYIFPSIYFLKDESCIHFHNRIWISIAILWWRVTISLKSTEPLCHPGSLNLQNLCAPLAVWIYRTSVPPWQFESLRIGAVLTSIKLNLGEHNQTKILITPSVCSIFKSNQRQQWAGDAGEEKINKVQAPRRFENLSFTLGEILVGQLMNKTWIFSVKNSFCLKLAKIGMMYR